MVYENPDMLLSQAKQKSNQTPIMVVWAKDDSLVPPEMTLKAYTILEAKSVEASGDGHNFGFSSEPTDKKNMKIQNRVVKQVLKFLKRTLTQSVTILLV